MQYCFPALGFSLDIYYPRMGHLIYRFIYGRMWFRKNVAFLLDKLCRTIRMLTVSDRLVSHLGEF